MLLFAASANAGYCILTYKHIQMRNSKTYLLGLSQNQMARGATLVHLATDWKIVMEQ